MQKVFVDTNVCLDLLSGRKPFHSSAAKLFSEADRGHVQLFVSSLSFPILDYILQSTFKLRNARTLLVEFKVLVSCLPVNDKIITLALTSEIKDFEDGVQLYTAIENNIPVLVTRNIADYQPAVIPVMTPESFLANYDLYNYSS